MQLKHIRDIQPKFLRGLYSSSVFVQPLGTTACRAALGHRSVSCVLLNTAVRRTTLGQCGAERTQDNLDY